MKTNIKNLEIRKATLKDFKALYGLIKTYAEESGHINDLSEDNIFGIFAAAQTTQNAHVFIAISDYNLVGFVYFYSAEWIFKKPVGRIEFFYVLPEYRKSTAAHELISMAISVLGANDVKMIFADTFFKKKANTYKNFLGKFGFAESGSLLILDGDY